MLFSKTIKYYSLYVKTFHPLALCVSLCAVSPPNKKKKNISELRDFSSNGPEKWIHTSSFFSPIQRDQETIRHDAAAFMQTPICHRVALGSLLSRSVVHSHAKWRWCSASVSDTVPVRNAAPSVPRERGRLALLCTVMQKQLDADFPPPALLQMVCELQRTFAEPLVQFTVGCRSHRTSLSLPSERGV